jgi:hypothetical protein
MKNKALDKADLDNPLIPTIDSKDNGYKVYEYTLEGLRGLAALWIVYSHIFFL